MNNVMEQVAAILAAVLGVAIVAVLVSQKAQTAGVIQAAGSAFSAILGTAISPVTGNSSGSQGNFSAGFPGIFGGG